MKASGFSEKEINGIYSFTGNFIYGRPLYVDEKQIYGIWFDGKPWVESWIIGPMTELKAGYYNLNYWVMSNRDTSCPAVTKVWDDTRTDQWADSITAIVQCLSGDNWKA